MEVYVEIHYNQPFLLRLPRIMLKMNRSLFMEIMKYKMDLSQKQFIIKNLTTIEPVMWLLLINLKTVQIKHKHVT